MVSGYLTSISFPRVDSCLTNPQVLGVSHILCFTMKELGEESVGERGSVVSCKTKCKLIEI